MDVKRHNGNVLPKKPRTNVRGFLIFRGCATKTGKSPSSNNPASDVRNADALSVSHPKQADLCMEKESHRITRGILCS